MTDKIVNKVANSSLLTIDLAEFYPASPVKELDIKDWLFQGLILKEKDFREAVEAHDWSSYKGSYVSVFCSADAIIPSWAYMLVTSKLAVYALEIVYGDRHTAFAKAFTDNILKGLKAGKYSGARVVIKGCGDKPTPENAFIAAVQVLMPVVKSIMYGEPCSTVPIYKQKNTNLGQVKADKK